MVNLYDSPAQAQFINTYVPIQFEGLYKVADKAQKELDTANALEDELLTNYSTLNTPIAAHKKEWDTNIFGGIRNLIDTEIQTSEDLKDPIKRSKLQAAARKLKMNPRTGVLLQSAQNAKDFIKKADPRWGAAETSKAIDYNEDGVFEQTNTPYTTWQEESAPLVDNLKEEVIGHDPSGMFLIKGISKDRVNNSITTGLPTIANSVSTNMRYELAKSQGQIPDKYAVKDQFGKVVDYDKNSYIKDMYTSANYDKSYSTLEPDQVAMMKWKEGQDWARLKYTQDAETNRAALKAKGANASKFAVNNTVVDMYGQVVGKNLEKLNSFLDYGHFDVKNGTIFTSQKFKDAGLLPYRQIIFNYKLNSDKINSLTSQLSSIMNDPSKTMEISDLNTKLNAARTIQKKDETTLERIMVEQKDRALFGKSSIITKDEAISINTANAPEDMVTRWYDKTMPEKKDIEFGSEKVKGYQPINTHDFELVDGKSLSKKDLSKNKLANDVSEALKNDRLSKLVTFTPTTLVSKGSDSKLKNTGYIYMSLAALSNISPEIASAKDATAIVKKIEEAGMQYVKGDVNGNNVKTDYVKIPVHSGIFNNGLVNDEIDFDKDKNTYEE
jgi:hypothetical protein